MNAFIFFSKFGQHFSNFGKRSLLGLALTLTLGNSSATAQEAPATQFPDYGGEIITYTEVWSGAPYPMDIRYYYVKPNNTWEKYADPDDQARYDATRERLKNVGLQFNYATMQKRPGHGRRVAPAPQANAQPSHYPNMTTPTLSKDMPPLPPQGRPASPTLGYNDALKGPANYYLSNGQNGNVRELGIDSTSRPYDAQRYTANYNLSKTSEVKLNDPESYKVPVGATPGCVVLRNSPGMDDEKPSAALEPYEILPSSINK